MLDFEKPDILEHISQYVDMNRSGQNYKGLCPFHTEKTPSFIVSPARQTFHCFGCHEHGDVITFIQKYKGVTFKEALANLGINKKGSYRPDPIIIRKRTLQQIFNQWKHDYCLYLADLLRWLDQAKSLCKNMDEVEMLADYYHKESLWEHEYQILLSKDDDAKFELFKGVWNGHKNDRQRA